MTSPISVGQVSVEVTADVSRLAKDLKAKVEAAFKGIDFDKAIRDSLGDRPFSVKVVADVDTSGIAAKVRQAAAGLGGRSAISVPAEVDARELAASVRRAARLAQASTPDIKIGVDAGGAGGVSSVLSGLAAAASSVVGQLGGVAQSLSGIGSAAGTAALAAGIVAGIGFAASAAVPAVYTLAGALASLPGIVAGAAAGFATLKLGFAGISDAFKKKAGGGGGSGGGGGGESEVARARRIAAAERGVEAARRGIAAASRGLQQAQRGLVEAQESYAEALAGEKRAQEAVARARKTAAERIDDLGRSLRGAVLDEKEAQLELRDAQRDLAAARTTFNPELIEEAELRYERAKLAVEEAADQVADLGEENADASKKGVEGSDEVVAALEDQKDAQKAVRDAANGIADAQDRLASANDGVAASYDSLISAQDALAQAKERAASAGGGGGGGGGGLDDTIKLAPEAQKFVDAIKALKPAFEALRLDVQNRLFAGLGTVVTNLATAWLPQLKTTLGSFADTFNRLAKNLASTISEPEFISNIGTAAETARANLEKIGTVITGPLTTAFGNLAAASVPFIDAVGTALASGLQRFADTVNVMAGDGRLDAFFARATAGFNDFKGIAKDVGSILGSVFSILTDSEDSGAASPFEQFKTGLHDFAEALKDPEVRARIQGYIEDFKQMAVSIATVVSVAVRLFDALQRIGDVLTGPIFNPLGALIKTGIGALLTADWSSIGNTVKTEAGKIGGAIWDGLKAGWEAVADVGSWIASKLWSGPSSLVGKVKAGLGISSPSKVFMVIGKDIIAGLLNGITGMFGALAATARSIPGRVRDGVGGVGSTLAQKGRDFVNGLRSGISGMYGSLSSTAAGLRGRVTSGLGSVGSLLYNAGRSIINGLINGIKSAFAALKSTLTTVTNLIPAWKGPMAKDRRLLAPTGQAIMGGLISGIHAERAALRSELGDITDSIRVGGTVDYSAYAATPDVARPDTAQTLLGWAPDATGDQILDAIRGLIRVRYGGNSQAALDTRR